MPNLRPAASFAASFAPSLSTFLAALLTLSVPICAEAQTQAKPGAVDDGIAARVVACTACHGREGRATRDGYFPRIAGKPAGYLYNQLVNFREGRREYAPMTHLVEYLSDDYLREIAGYFAALDLPYAPPPPVPAADVTARGEALVLHGDAALRIPACVQCHGAAMTGVLPATPGLLGLPRDYLNSQLGAWKSAKRHAAAPDCMAGIAEKLTPADVSAVTGWLAAQPLPTSSHPAEASSAPLPLACGSVPAKAL